MGIHDKGESHIDSTKFELWVPNALGLKGVPTKPQRWDTEKVIPTLDMGQGGFSNEYSQETTFWASVSIAGQTQIQINPGPSCKFATGLTPAFEPRNESPFHARVTRCLVAVYFDQAGATALDGRYYRVSLGSSNDNGNNIWLESSNERVDDKIERYHQELDETMIVQPGNEFAVEIELQADWSGGAGPAVFPANTEAFVFLQWYKKPLGGQLPI